MQSIDRVAGVSKTTLAQMTDVATTAEEQTATMDEIAEAAKTVAVMAQEMQEEVTKFRVQ